MIEDRIDRVLNEKKDPLYDIVDTQIFNTYLMSYEMLKRKANDTLISNMRAFITNNKKILQSDRDTLQWFKDDIGEYFNGKVEPHVIKKILRLIEDII